MDSDKHTGPSGYTEIGVYNLYQRKWESGPIGPAAKPASEIKEENKETFNRITIGDSIPLTEGPITIGRGTGGPVEGYQTYQISELNENPEFRCVNNYGAVISLDTDGFLNISKAVGIKASKMREPYSTDPDTNYSWIDVRDSDRSYPPSVDGGYRISADKVDLVIVRAKSRQGGDQVYSYTLKWENDKKSFLLAAISPDPLKK